MLRAVVSMAKVLHGFLKMPVASAVLAHVPPINVHLRLDHSPCTYINHGSLCAGRVPTRK